MNLRCLAFCALFSLCGVACVSQVSEAQQRKKPKSCWDTALTQREINECAGKELRATEARLTALLKNLGIGPEDPAQKAWEAYRDAQIEAIYPDPEKNIVEYGSVYPMCFSLLKAKLAEGRIRDLKVLTTSGEGDVCHGLKPVSQRQDGKPKSAAQEFAKVQVGNGLSCNLI